MCGRVRCTLRADDVSRACYFTRNPTRILHADRYRPANNVPPGSHLPVVRRGDGSDGQGAIVHCMKWGLIPSFTKKTEKPDHYKMFNARSESIREKASFRRLVPNNRCLVVAEGFYEWKKDGSKKQPYYIHFKDGRPLVLAALYDSWEGSEGETIYTFTILTTSSSSALRWLHDRMPVIFGGKASIDSWLNGGSKLDTLLKPYEEPDLGWYPVTPAMGNPSFDGPECIKEIRLKTELKNPIESFFSRKGITSEQKSDLQAEKPLKRPSVTREGKILKEPESEDNIEHRPSVTEEGDADSKPNVALLAYVEDEKIRPKRDYEEFSADLKPTDAETKKLFAGSVKKKGNSSTGKWWQDLVRIVVCSRDGIPCLSYSA